LTLECLEARQLLAGDSVVGPLLATDLADLTPADSVAEASPTAEPDDTPVMPADVSSHVVHVAYLIPSNRDPQPEGVENLQTTLLWYQDWYRDQMDRYGFGPKTFELETEADGVTPLIHVVDTSRADTYYHQDQWSRIIDAGTDAGLSVWEDGQIWLLVSESLVMNADASIAGSVTLGASFGSGSDPGVAVATSSPLATPDYLTDNRTYGGLTLPEVGPYPLVANVTYPWYEGATLSSVASSHLGAVLHEMSHAFGLSHDFRNDANTNGNLMGNGFRGLRGWLYPDAYSSHDLRLSYAAALALNASRYFNPDGDFTDDRSPSLSILTSGNVAPVGGQIEIRFTASDSVGLAAALLQHEGDTVAEMPLSGTSATATFKTVDYNPGDVNNYTILVYDVQGNRNDDDVIIVPATKVNRAPIPYFKVTNSQVKVGETVTLDAFFSTDPDDTSPQLKFEWDLDGDGTFDTAPSTEYLHSASFDTPGGQVIRVRVTDEDGARAISAPLALRVLPTAEVVGRYLFYNHSVFDGDNPGLGPADDAALATDKTALMPGDVAAFANYTSFKRGLNGLMVDVAGAAAVPTLDDFTFRLGNDDDPSSWTAAPQPSGFAVRQGAGVGGSDRVTIAWADWQIVNRWLEVTVRAENLGLAADDVFYFGSAVGEAGNSPLSARVTTTDVLLARNNPRNFLDPAKIDYPYDFDRNRRVNVTDVLLARNNQSTFLTALSLIDLTGEESEEAAVAEAFDFALLAEV